MLPANAGSVLDRTVDMDLKKFFDAVSRSKLFEILSQAVKDGREISPIAKYLCAGVIRPFSA